MHTKIAVTYLITAILMLIGTFMPWISVLGMTINGSQTDDGDLMFVMVVVVVLASLFALGGLTKTGLILSLIGSAVSLIVSIYHIQKILGASDTELDGLHASPGTGLWVILIAGIFGLVGPLMVRLSVRETTVSERTHSNA